MNICKKKKNNRKGFCKQCFGNLRVKIKDFVECLKIYWIWNIMKVFCSIVDFVLQKIFKMNDLFLCLFYKCY